MQRNPFSNLVNHKILHKVGKQWVAIGIFALVLSGATILKSNSVHASSINTKIQPVRITQQANQLHKKIINNNIKSRVKTEARKPSRNVNTNYHLKHTVQPWSDPGHKGMKLMGTRNYNHVHANYYYGKSLNNPGRLLEISGHGLLKESYLMSNKLPRNMKNSGSDSLTNPKLNPKNDTWRLKVDPGIYINNSAQSFVGNTSNYHVLNFVTMDLSGLNTKRVKNFAYMFSEPNEDVLTNREKRVPWLQAKINNPQYGIGKSDKNTENVDDATSINSDGTTYLGNIYKLNIKDFDTRQASDETGMFEGNGDCLTDLVLGKHFSLKPIHNYLIDDQIGSSDGFTDMRITTPAHLNLYKQFYHEFVEEGWEGVPVLFDKRAIVKNQNRKTVDPKIHQTYQNELRKGTQPAGTYYIAMDNREYRNYKHEYNELNHTLALIKEIKHHPHYYLNHRFSKSTYKYINEFLNGSVGLGNINSDQNLGIYPYIDENSETPQPNYQLLNDYDFIPRIVQLGKSDSSDNLTSIFANRREFSGHSDAINPKYINNALYEFGWIEGEHPSNNYQRNQLINEFNDVKHFINHYPKLSRKYIHPDYINQQHITKKMFYTGAYLTKHPNKNTAYYRKQKWQAKKVDKWNKKEDGNNKALNKVYHRYLNYFTPKLSSNDIKKIRLATRFVSDDFEIGNIIKGENLKNMRAGFTDDSGYSSYGYDAIRTQMVNNKAYRFGWLLSSIHINRNKKNYQLNLAKYEKAQEIVTKYPKLKHLKVYISFNNEDTSYEIFKLIPYIKKPVSPSQYK